MKELLGEELYNQVKAKLGDKEIYINDGSYVPRSRMNELSDKLKATSEKISSYEKQIGETQELLKGSEDLKAKYTGLQEKYTTELSMKDKEISNITKATAVREALINEGGKHLDLLMKTVNLDSITMSDGNITGLTDVIKGLKTSYADLFVVKTKDQGTTKGTGNAGTKGTNDTGDQDWSAIANTLL